MAGDNNFSGMRRLARSNGFREQAVQAFTKAQAMLTKVRRLYNNKGVISSTSFLRLERPAPDSAVNELKFDVVANSGTLQTPTERRLKNADTFVVTSLVFYIGSVVRVALAPPTAAAYAAAKLRTSVNRFMLDFLSAAAVDAIEIIYNSTLSIRIDSRIVIDGLPMRKFYRVPQTQENIGATTGANLPTAEWPLEMYGQIDLDEGFEFVGTANIEVTINTPTGVALNNIANFQVVPTFIFEGILNQNASKLANYASISQSY